MFTLHTEWCACLKVSGLQLCLRLFPQGFRLCFLILPERPLSSLSGRNSQQALHAQQIQRTHRQAEHPFHSPSASKFRLPPADCVFDPTEHRFHPLTLLLTLVEPRIVALFRPQPVGPLFRLHRVLRHMRHYPPYPPKRSHSAVARSRNRWQRWTFRCS
jgi:hypothetical protein